MRTSAGSLQLRTRYFRGRRSDAVDAHQVELFSRDTTQCARVIHERFVVLRRAYHGGHEDISANILYPAARRASSPTSCQRHPQWHGTPACCDEHPPSLAFHHEFLQVASTRDCEPGRHARTRRPPPDANGSTASGIQVPESRFQGSSSRVPGSRTHTAGTAKPRRASVSLTRNGSRTRRKNVRRIPPKARARGSVRTAPR